MNISTLSCRNLQVLAGRIKLRVALLCASMLFSHTAFTHSAFSTNNYHLSTTIHFNKAQCPSQRMLMPGNDTLRSGEQRPDNHLFQHYNPYKSIFTQQPLRPLTFNQQLAMIDVFEAQGISVHQYNLFLMVNLSQKKNLSMLTAQQLSQAKDWREVEGAVSEEKACRNNHTCKEKTSSALFRMGMYDSQVPDYQHYDYTLLLGGSIQQMQWRMMMLLSLFRETLNNPSLSLGEIIALTCDRVVLKEEADGRFADTMFMVNYDRDNGRAKANIDDDHGLLLTETTSYQAIYHSLKRMSRSKHYFERFRETSLGYHTTMPLSFLSKNSFEKSIYFKRGDTFQLSSELPDILKAFFQRYLDPEIIETKMKKEGETLKKRPTTKQTVKEWLARLDNQLTCRNPEFCKILIISNAPNLYYQHTAVVQALEESISSPTHLTYQISTAGPGAAIEIPTNAPLDNLSKFLYLLLYNPKY